MLVEIFVCVRVFLKQKIYILIHIRLMQALGDKKIFTRPISGNTATFFGPSEKNVFNEIILSA